MAYSSVKAMLNVSRQNNQPLWDVILQSDYRRMDEQEQSGLGTVQYRLGTCHGICNCIFV